MPTPAPQVPSDGSRNFLFGSELYVNPPSAVAQFLASHPNDPNAALLKKIADQPTGIWLTDGTEIEVHNQVKQVLKDANGKLVTFVVYNIPNRDNGG